MALSKPRFDDLPDDMIIEIFSHLSTNKLLSTERVSRTWKRCVDKTLNRVEVVSFKKLSKWEYDPNQCQHLRQADFTKTLVVVDRESARVEEYDPLVRLITFAKVDSMVSVLKRCQQVNCLILDDRKAHLEFDNIETLIKLMKTLPQLECLHHGRFIVNNFNDIKWFLLCQEVFGQRMKHLTISGPIKSKNIIDSLIMFNESLDFVYFKQMTKIKCYYLESLANRNHIDVSLEFTDSTASKPINANAAAVISRAKYLSIGLTYLKSVAKHCPTFGRLNSLKVTYYGLIDEFAVEFPVLEHLSWNYAGYYSETIINHLANYNLTGLKSLTIRLINDNILAALAGKLTSLKKLVLYCSNNFYLPADLLLLLNRLDDLTVIHEISSAYQFDSVVQSFKVLAKMSQLKRCRVDIKNKGFRWNSLSEDRFIQLTKAKATLRKSLPFVEIDPQLNNCLGKVSKAKKIKTT